jgi:hypothetical protein
VAARGDADPGLETQRAGIEAQFRAGRVPRGAGEPRVRAGGRPGDPLPPLVAGPLIDGVTDTEVIITGDAPGQRVAVLFRHESFPGIRFGHRFPHPGEELAEYSTIWLQEEIQTGALHRMMRDAPAADAAGIVWTAWGS